MVYELLLEHAALAEVRRVAPVLLRCALVVLSKQGLSRSLRC